MVESHPRGKLCDEIGNTTAQIHGSHPDALVSIMLRMKTLEEIGEHAACQNFDLLCFEATEAPALNAANYGKEYAKALAIFDSCGKVPAWNCSPTMLKLENASLSTPAAVLASTFQPGIVHFHKDVPITHPTIRHALRFRELLNLANASALLDDRLAGDGIVWIHTEQADLVINFGPNQFLIPDDGRVLLTSVAEVEKDGTYLIIPPRELAWVRRS